MRALLTQKKTELEGMLMEYEQRIEETEEHSQLLAAEKQKLKNQLLQTEEQWVQLHVYLRVHVLYVHVHVVHNNKKLKLQRISVPLTQLFQLVTMPSI